jgi:hypothetical protein
MRASRGQPPACCPPPTTPSPTARDQHPWVCGVAGCGEPLSTTWGRSGAAGERWPPVCTSVELVLSTGSVGWGWGWGGGGLAAEWFACGAP